VTSTIRDRWSPAESVAGVMASGAMFLGFFELAYRPFRLAPVAALLAVAAAVMSTRQQRLIGLAFAVIGVCFVAGAALQVLTHHPLY
jgi:hypothetical protein